MPSNKALKAIHLKKVEEYTLEARDPLPLGAQVEVSSHSSSGLERSDSELARELSDKLNHSDAEVEGTPPPPSYDEAMTNDPRLSSGIERSDSDLARELSKHLNGE